MLTRLKVNNFKSWESLDLSFGKITGIFGTNSSGKSSILQFLLLLKQTKDATDRATALELNGNLVELGTMQDVLHKHETARALDWELSWRAGRTIKLYNTHSEPPSEFASGDILTLTAKVALQREVPITERFDYELSKYKFILAQNGSNYDLNSKSSSNLEEDFKFIRPKGRPLHLPGPIKSYAFPDQARTYFQNSAFLSDLEASYESFTDSIFYLGPLRGHPKRDYLWARARPSGVGVRGEKTIDAILAATAANETRNLKRGSRYMPFQAMIAHWLREMGLIDTFEIEEIKEGSSRWQANVTTKKNGSKVFLTDVGFGVSQILPVITLLQYVPEGSIVILEQPEIHLHPLAQAELADVIIQAATHRKVQVIVESHSEHLLLRLQRRIADAITIKSNDFKLYFCDAPDGDSKLEELEIDLFGRILNWPDHFMGDAFTETAKAELARLKRMQAGAA